MYLLSSVFVPIISCHDIRTFTEIFWSSRAWLYLSLSMTSSAIFFLSSSVNKAVKEYGVPRATLQGRITGRVVHGTKPRPKIIKQKKLNFLRPQQRLDMVKLENK